MKYLTFRCAKLSEPEIHFNKVFRLVLAQQVAIIELNIAVTVE